MKIDRVETGMRTLLMLGDFLHRDPAEINMTDDLRDRWHLTDRKFQVLELWIEGPINTLPGFFQDVQADVRVSDLQNPKTVSTVESLAELIWNNIPAQNQIP